MVVRVRECCAGFGSSPFPVGSIAATVITVLIRRNRLTLLERIAVEREISSRLKAENAELTDRFRAFSKQKPLSPQFTDLEFLVASISGLLRRTLGATIAVEINVPPDLWIVWADPGQIMRC